jgi:hypothetical protein
LELALEVVIGSSGILWVHREIPKVGMAYLIADRIAGNALESRKPIRFHDKDKSFTRLVSCFIYDNISLKQSAIS